MIISFRQPKVLVVNMRALLMIIGMKMYLYQGISLYLPYYKEPEILLIILPTPEITELITTFHASNVVGLRILDTVSPIKPVINAFVLSPFAKAFKAPIPAPIRISNATAFKIFVILFFLFLFFFKIIL